MEEAFDWLQRFFLSNCDGDWEHYSGCRIETMSDPGWLFEFDLKDTPFEKRVLEPLEDRTSPLDWLKCEMNEGVFKAMCAPRRLAECITILRDVVEGRKGQDGTSSTSFKIEPPP